MYSQTSDGVSSAKSDIVLPSFLLNFFVLDPKKFNRKAYVLGASIKLRSDCSFQTCITDKYPMVVAFLIRIGCVDSSHHDACAQQRSTSNEVAGLFVVGRLLHVVGKASVTYEHDDVVWLV